MRVYRLLKKKYGITLSGAGAALRNNRWNSRGTSIVYTSESRALALVEVAVYLSIVDVPGELVMVTIDIPKSVSMQTLRRDKWPIGWDALPHRALSRVVGDDFIHAEKYCVLKVPSAVVPGDFNYLINPAHKDFGKIKIVEQDEFGVDRRLSRK